MLFKLFLHKCNVAKVGSAPSAKSFLIWYENLSILKLKVGYLFSGPKMSSLQGYSDRGEGASRPQY